MIRRRSDAHMTFTILTILLTLGTLSWVLWPLLMGKRSRIPMPDPEDRMLESLIRKKESIYTNIKDLRFDYQMGKLSEVDFQSLEAGYQAEAANVLQRIEILTSDTRFNSTIEEEVTRRRRNGRAQDVPSAQPCGACGASVRLGNKFCNACGATVVAAAPTCGACGSLLQPAMKFCPECGARGAAEGGGV